MKKLNSKDKFFFMAILISLSACLPCNECNDPLLTKVKVTGCNTQIQWEFSQAVQHSNGTMTSSISIVPDPSAGVETTIADSVTTNVYITATDTICGIKCITVTGGFGLVCNNPPFGALSLHGLIDVLNECSPLTNCVFKSMRQTIPNVASYGRNCTAPKTLASGSVSFTAIVENYGGQRDTSNLTVRFQ